MCSNGTQIVYVFAVHSCALHNHFHSHFDDFPLIIRCNSGPKRNVDAILPIGAALDPFVGILPGDYQYDAAVAGNLVCIC
jgi:hypothetical protein